MYPWYLREIGLKGGSGTGSEWEDYLLRVSSVSGYGVKKKVRFVVNLRHQSQHWPKGSARMEKMEGFSADLERYNVQMHWNLASEYWNLYIHPDVRDYFLFAYNGKFYRCSTLPFG